MDVGILLVDDFFSPFNSSSFLFSFFSVLVLTRKHLDFQNDTLRFLGDSFGSSDD